MTEYVFEFASEEDGRRAAAFIERARVQLDALADLGPHEYLHIAAPRDVARPGTASPQSCS